VRTLIRWAGDDPEREGLVGTPDRGGARLRGILRRLRRRSARDAAADLRGGRGLRRGRGAARHPLRIALRAPHGADHRQGPVSAYLPDRRVVGISKLARVVDAYAYRLQIQEKLTAQIANTLQEGPAAARRRCRHRGGAPVHDHARRAQVRRCHGDQPQCWAPSATTARRAANS